MDGLDGSVSRSFPSVAESAGEARRFVREVLDGRPAAVDVEAAVLLTSELVANTVLHTDADELVVNVTVDTSGLTVAVGDDDPVLPVLRRPSPEDADGRGLPLVDYLATSWGATSIERNQKWVWFRLDLPSP